jgi:hypothetical protein
VRFTLVTAQHPANIVVRRVLQIGRLLQRHHLHGQGEQEKVDDLERSHVGVSVVSEKKVYEG